MDVYVPASYSLEASTGGGNIVTDDVNGRATLPRWAEISLPEIFAGRRIFKPVAGTSP